MYLNYAELIQEDPGELARLERRYRSGPLADRLKVLRLLKRRAYRSQPLAAPWAASVVEAAVQAVATADR